MEKSISMTGEEIEDVIILYSGEELSLVFDASLILTEADTQNLTCKIKIAKDTWSKKVIERTGIVDVANRLFTFDLKSSDTSGVSGIYQGEVVLYENNQIVKIYIFYTTIRGNLK